MLAVPANQPLFDGLCRSTARAIAGELPAATWQRASAGAGSKGPREYDWAVEAFGAVDGRGWQPWLVVRRHRERPGERAYFFARGPAGTPAAELVRAAGARWAVEECFELAKGDCGLDGYEVRSWAGWHRHVTLSLLALAAVAVAVARASSRRRPTKKAGAELIRLSVPEVRRLLARPAGWTPTPAGRVLAWAAWRRHQHRARACHYKTRNARPPD